LSRRLGRGRRARGPDGKTALIRGDVDAWAGLDPMMAQAARTDVT
jgi:sulfonate transport system substrate-binding protein